MLLALRSLWEITGVQPIVPPSANFVDRPRVVVIYDMGHFYQTDLGTGIIRAQNPYPLAQEAKRLGMSVIWK